MLEEGTIVVITAKHPAGIPTINVEGEIGLITRIDKDNVRNEYNYSVATRTNSWVYGEDEIREATDEEIKNELIEILSR